MHRVLTSRPLLPLQWWQRTRARSHTSHATASDAQSTLARRLNQPRSRQRQAARCCSIPQRAHKLSRPLLLPMLRPLYCRKRQALRMRTCSSSHTCFRATSPCYRSTLSRSQSPLQVPSSRLSVNLVARPRRECVRLLCRLMRHALSLLNDATF